MVFLKNKLTPTYLHFLDRELRRAEGAAYTDKMILDALMIAVINSQNYCYCSASLLLESNSIFPKSMELLLELEKFGLVKLLANEHSFDEFIFSRQKIYAHAPSRYPMYFSDDNKYRNFWPQSPLMVNSSTTSTLRTNFFEWLNNSDSPIKIDKNIFKTKDLKIFETKLFKEKDKAITLDLFLSKEQLLVDLNRRDSGRLISYFYTKRYLDLYSGDILCGLPFLGYYDRISNTNILNDYNILSSVLKCFYIPEFFFQRGWFNLTLFVSFVNNNTFKHIQIELISIICGLKRITIDNFGNDKNRMLSYFKNNFNKTNNIVTNDITRFVESLYLDLTSAAMQLSRNNDSFNTEYEMVKQTLSTNKKVLIVTATQIETTAFIKAVSNRGKPVSHNELGKIVYWNLGVINNSELILIKSGMGSSGVSGSTLTIKDAVAELKPDYVIMIGIAFGLRKAKQQIGQILISRELENYEYAKVIQNSKEKTMLQRGNKIPSGVTLLSRFENSTFIYENSPCEIGFIISGDKLVDSEEFVTKLIESFPEAIGGEMEGTGLQSVCHREGIEWLLIKGICDWGFDKQIADKDIHQKLAIENVCDFLLFTLANFEL